MCLLTTDAKQRFWFNSLLKFLVQSNLVVSISGGFLTFGIAKHFSINHSIQYGLLVFLLIFAVYTLQRIADKSGFHDVFLEKHDFSSIIVSVIALILALILGISLFNFSFLLVTLSLVFAFLCYWYTMPVLGKKLREVPGIKIVVIAFTWTYACVFFPALNEGVELNKLLILSCLIFIYITATILPFDIRDVATDKMKHGTIPQLIGVIPTKIIGILLLLIFVLGNLFYEVVKLENWVFFVATISQIILILFVSQKRNYLYFGLVDALIVLLGVSYLY